MRKKVCYEVGVPVWFLLIGTLGTAYPPSSPAVAIFAFVMALLIVPFLTLAADAYCMHRRAKPCHVADASPQSPVGPSRMSAA